MKNLALLVLISIMMFSCQEKESLPSILLTKDYSLNHPNWTFSSDTIVKHFTIKFEEFEVPAKISWVVASDTSGCLRIGFIQLDRLGGKTKIKVSDFSVLGTGLCGMRDDDRRFETLYIKANISSYKWIKQYSYIGPIAEINGLGEFYQR